MNFWYSDKINWQASLLAPLSKLVESTAVRRRSNRNVTPYSSPVIVVGNLSVGGTGKTPMIIWLVTMLQSKGYRVGVVSRGYGATTKPAYPYQVNADSDAATCGDEPKLIQKRTGCAVVVDPQRHRAVQFLLEQQSIDVVISDDGMQHYAMHRDIEILMVDPDRVFGNQQLLPAGPLREPISRLSTVDFIVTKGKSVASLNGSETALLQFSTPRNYKGEPLAVSKVRVVSGLGNFNSFMQSVEGLGYEVIENIQFKDHQLISSDALQSDSLAIIITEKDAVKLDLSGYPNVYVLKLDYSLPELFKHNLITKLEAIEK